MLFYEDFGFVWFKIKFYAKNRQFSAFSYVMAKMIKFGWVLAKYFVSNHTNPKSLQNNILFLSYEKIFETKILVPWDLLRVPGAYLRNLRMKYFQTTFFSLSGVHMMALY